MRENFVVSLMARLLTQATGTEVTVEVRGREAFTALLSIDEVTGEKYLIVKDMPLEHQEAILRGLPVEDLGAGVYGINLVKMMKSMSDGYTPTDIQLDP